MVIRQYSYQSILCNAFVGIESVSQLKINFRLGERSLRTFISGWSSEVESVGLTSALNNMTASVTVGLFRVREYQAVTCWLSD